HSGSPLSLLGERGKGDRGLPLAGLRVADFSWVGVGPITAKCLADHGATVVHVENDEHTDVVRGILPFKDSIPGINRSQFFGDFNSSKLGMCVNIKHPAGLEIAKRLVTWADVVIESFSPGAMTKLGLGYD